MLAEQIVNGIIPGSLHALIAQGYMPVFGVLDRLNFAHSEILMLGGFIALASVALGAPVWVALIVDGTHRHAGSVNVRGSRI